MQDSNASITVESNLDIEPRILDSDEVQLKFNNTLVDAGMDSAALDNKISSQNVDIGEDSGSGSGSINVSFHSIDDNLADFIYDGEEAVRSLDSLILG